MGEVKTSVEELLKRWKTRPIRNCPGRYVIVDCPLPPNQILGPSVPVSSYSIATSRDPVFIAALPDGGLISYQQQDGTFLHTLNNPEGFRRKLEKLGFPEAVSNPP
jgi:hypothetical protein